MEIGEYVYRMVRLLLKPRRRSDLASLPFLDRPWYSDTKEGMAGSYMRELQSMAAH